MKICQCCGKEIKYGYKAVKIESGIMGRTAHPHDIISRINGVDWFHHECDISIRRSK